jgi:hypothetical protein
MKNILLALLVFGCSGCAVLDVLVPDEDDDVVYVKPGQTIVIEGTGETFKTAPSTSLEKQ